ncbi:hypothetical protein C8Q75DRAFT_527703 [Abortiporus biennis]|nr:hypothetical protein C8Q75DRAFT_527703 [Abortiporus biennis]
MLSEALSFVKNAILVSKKRLITSDVNGSLVDIDAYLSRSLHKVLGMGRAVPISEALQILSLRAIHTEVRLPRNVLQVMPMILISAKHLLNMRRSKDTLNVNPFSVICMVLCMLEKLPLEWFKSSPKELRQFLDAAESILPPVDQRLSLYMTQCDELARKLNAHVPGLADGILNTIHVLQDQ